MGKELIAKQHLSARRKTCFEISARPSCRGKPNDA
jgi:hypothetical protein